ncbi:MAG: hypothetical protein F6K28_32235 [Microcoleus sp. SIO2G3]|nr:hypothetical protein [Microcoleus sp. SIO2G3]
MPSLQDATQTAPAKLIALHTDYAIAFPLIQQEGNDRAFLTNTSKSAIALCTGYVIATW